MNFLGEAWNVEYWLGEVFVEPGGDWAVERPEPEEPEDEGGHHYDGFLFSLHPNGGEVSSEPRRAMNVNSFAGDRKNSKLWRGGGLDLGRWPEVTGNLPQCHILYKSWSKYFLTKNFYWLWKPAILHIPDVKMHVDYGPGIRLAEKISKTPQIGFLFHILSFITLKPEVFPVTSGYQSWSAPRQYGTFKAFFQPPKEFGSIALLVKICIDPPIWCNERKKSSK